MITRSVRQIANRFRKDQRGITGLETAIVLVAFVLVASVFAYAVLNTGLFSSDRAKQSVTTSLKQTESTMQTKGTIIAEADSTTSYVYKVHIVVNNVPGGDPISLNSNAVTLTYSDKYQVVNLQPANWTPTWLAGAGTGNIMQAGDTVEILVTLPTLTTNLGTNTTFTIQIKPQVGAVVAVTRTTPVVIEKVMNLS